AVRAEQVYADTAARLSRGASVLEYGCFNGWNVPTLASYGAREIVGIDISERLITEASAAHGSIARFSVMDGHRLALADESVDAVIGRSILHHLDFETAILEIHRVLKPGGGALFIEPLRGNPAAKALRMLTPGARTKEELPLSRAQVRQADRLFTRSDHHFSGLVSVGLGLASSLVSNDPANAAMRFADAADLALARSPLRWWMRMITLRWTK
ncbi:MAG TPA: methyltransferase domain-containing protein, partial [Usitatibacter sp.]|nr:methyltransferase domain-containing protein [Usitatibacter sp.]